MVDRRYEVFGWDYEGVNPLAEEAVGWYLRWAEECGGEVLVLACGTGRLVCRLAEAGLVVTGMDLSATMLGLAAENVARLTDEARGRVRLVKADMAAFDLGRRFGTILIADNSFRELNTRKDLLRCLRCIKRHLLTGGKLLITERRFDASLYVDGKRSWGWSEARRHPQTGEMVSRRGEVRLSKDGKRMCGRFVYKTVHADGEETLEECPWSGPVLRTEEYVELLARAGFATRTFGGYREVDDDGDDALLCFVSETQ